MVHATVNVPHGLCVSALTTTSASTASTIIISTSTPIIAMMPGTSPSSSRSICPSERPPWRSDRPRIMKSCTAPANTTPTRIHSVPGR